MKKVVKSIICLILTCLFFENTLLSQNKEISLSVRISLQSDYQKANFKDAQFPYDFKEHKTTKSNFGIDILAEKKMNKKLKAHIGIGYFRNKFNFKRSFNHSLLNVSADSVPIGASTSNYIFHLFRCPVGIAYKLQTNNKFSLSLGIENIISFSFQQVYNSNLSPLISPNKKYSKFQYYSNSILLFFEASKQFNKNSSLSVIPYARVFNSYKRENPILYETNSKPFSRAFDALGISVKYSINLKK